jgi:tetratricopeptide (TPR) repeat protein
MRKARVLIELGRTHEAFKTLDALRAQAQQRAIPAEVESILSTALLRLGRLDEAIVAARRAVAAEPDNPQFHEELAEILLTTGNLEQGWSEFEYRLQKPTPRLSALTPGAPMWLGEEVRGKRLLVLWELGHGDTIQFSRYLKLLHEAGAIVTATAQPALLPLMSSMQIPVEWRMRPPEDVRFDFQVFLLSLPHRFETRIDTLPGKAPYLVADPEKVRAWASHLGARGLRIGIAWQGDPDHARDHLRSIPLAQFAPLSKVQDVRLISLQAIRGLDQLEHLPPSLAVEDYGPVISNNPDGMSEIAGAMASLDLIVTSDTAIAHLAGALGRPVWLALSDDAEWRWLQGRADSPWYPTMRLFRQKTPGDWLGVFTDMASHLAGDSDP